MAETQKRSGTFPRVKYLGQDGYLLQTDRGTWYFIALLETGEPKKVDPKELTLTGDTVTVEWDAPLIEP